MGQDSTGGEAREEDGSYIGISEFSFNHALLLATDLAHRKPSNKLALAKVEYQVRLGENPPINEWRVLITPGSG